jgi:23S rRNA pseudouridine2605 synthase
VAGTPSPADLQQLLKGVWLSDGHVRAKRLHRLKSQGASTWMRIVLNEGKNREIRRMLARLGHKVLNLRRVALGRVQLKSLAPGKARRLTPEELALLQRVARDRRPEQSRG